MQLMKAALNQNPNMKNNRTLSRVLLALFVLTGFLIYRGFGDWKLIMFPHIFAGAFAYMLGLSNQPHRRVDLVEVGMMILAILGGFISLFTTSFVEVEGHEEGDFHLW